MKETNIVNYEYDTIRYDWLY